MLHKFIASLTKWLFLTLIAVAVFIGLYTWGTLSFIFSSGERVGYVQKLSHKGWFCKTWEGELFLLTQAGVPPEKFAFTVKDLGLVDKINATLGQKVSLEYEQHIGIPSSCFGDTEYFIVNLKVIAP